MEERSPDEITPKGQKVSNVINIRKEMKAVTKFDISPDAINEYRLFILDGVEMNVPIMERIAKGDGRTNTIKNVDVIRLFGYSDSKVEGKFRYLDVAKNSEHLNRTLGEILEYLQMKKGVVAIRVGVKDE